MAKQVLKSFKELNVLKDRGKEKPVDEDTNKLEPGVEEHIAKDETSQIHQELKKTTKNLTYNKNKGFGKPVVTYGEDVVSPITNVPWEAWNMKDFDFIEVCRQHNMIDSDNRIILYSNKTESAVLKQFMLLMLVHFKEVKILMNSLISPKATVKFRQGKYIFHGKVFKTFIFYHFPEDKILFKTVNISNLITSIILGLEKNPVRPDLSLEMFEIITGGDKQVTYKLDSLITMLNIEELKNLIERSKKHTHYDNGACSLLLENAVRRHDAKEGIADAQEIPNNESTIIDPEIREALNAKDEIVVDPEIRNAIKMKELDEPQQFVKEEFVHELTADHGQIIDIKGIQEILKETGGTLEFSFKIKIPKQKGSGEK